MLLYVVLTISARACAADECPSLLQLRDQTLRAVRQIPDGLAAQAALRPIATMPAVTASVGALPGAMPGAVPGAMPGGMPGATSGAMPGAMFPAPEYLRATQSFAGGLPSVAAQLTSGAAQAGSWREPSPFTAVQAAS